MLGTLYVKSELEVSGQYADILLVPKTDIQNRYSILIEFKYIKQEDYDKDNSLLESKQKQAKHKKQKMKKIKMKIKII